MLYQRLLLGALLAQKNMATDFYNSLDYPSFMEANKKWPKAKRKKGHVNTKIETHVATGKCFITFHMYNKAEKMRSVIAMVFLICSILYLLFSLFQFFTRSTLHSKLGIFYLYPMFSVHASQILINARILIMMWLKSYSSLMGKCIS